MGSTWGGKLHETQLCVKRQVASRANDTLGGSAIVLRMAQVTRIHAAKTPHRMHYIPEWSEKRGIKQADIVRQMPAGLEVDKSSVSRWFRGKLPSERHLIALAALLELEEVAALFRSPEDDWLMRLFRHRTEEEKARIAQLVEIAVPQSKTGTAG